ncbi:MAG: hypothetical protein J7J86_03805 [Bacteroidales bacterium]|nr:hypothetical protein [Bacteroidales bacterium]
MNKISLKIISLLIISFLTILLFSTSCEKNEGIKDIPSYIQIDSISVVTDYFSQGTASNNITDAWVYIDEDFIGTFELPACFPVLMDGEHIIRIDPGIKLNGISSTRSPYPFYNPITKNINLVRGEICKIYEKESINPVSQDTTRYITTTYKDNVVFEWMEDFESSSLSIKTTSKSDTTITRVSDEAFEGLWSGKVSLDSIRNIFEATTKNDFQNPGNNSAIFLELNYKNNNIYNVGIFSNCIDKVIQTPIIVLNKTDKWKKIYINLTIAVNREYNLITYDPFFEISKEDEVENPEIYFDNIKLVHF